MNIKSTNSVFWMIATLHVVAWTLIPILLNPNGPLDVLEGIEWGRHFQLGYDKHPPLAPWLTYIFYYIGGKSLWSIYLSTQFLVVCGFWYIWQLSLEFLPKRVALVSALMLESIFYYTHTAIKFNPDALLLLLWPMIFYYGYQAATKTSTYYWAMLGVSTGLGFISKYTTVLPIIALATFFVTNVGFKNTLKNRGLYISILIFFIIIGPHLLWLLENDFLPFRYALTRTEATEISWMSHILYPGKFLIAQIATLLPTLLLSSALWKNKNKFTIIPFNRNFVIILGLGPLILTLITSSILGKWLYTMWAVPLFSLTGLIYAVLLSPQELSDKQFKNFIKILLAIMSLMAIAYGAARQVIPQYKAKYANVHYPGELISKHAEKIWQDRFSTPAKYVAGPRWITTNLSTYMKDHPINYFEWSQDGSPWVDESDLRMHGAIFVWEVRELGNNIPKDIQDRFPSAEMIEIKSFDWRVVNNGEPLEVAFAILPPA